MNAGKKMPVKLLYFVTEDWYFCSHRLELARAAQQAGYDVHVLTRVNADGDKIRAEGFHLIPLTMQRGSINPLRELQALFQVWQAYQQIKPDIVHHVALKPVLYGGLVSCLLPHLKTVNLVAGLGAIFSSDKPKSRLLRPVVKLLFRWLFNRHNSKVIVQNSEDQAVLINELRINPAHVVLIKGSGVNIQHFSPQPEPNGKVSVALVSRLLWDKGIGEFVAAVKLLKAKGLDFSALLVGKPDPENMASVTEQQLKIWQASELVECVGHKEDIAQLWQETHIAVLPSYREGLPKSLLEAAACGRPIVTTDTSGCKEIVQDGVNGFFVPVRDVKTLANAVEKLILDPALRKRMGQAGRVMVEQEFASEKIIMQTLEIYRQFN